MCERTRDECTCLTICSSICYLVRCGRFWGARTSGRTGGRLLARNYGIWDVFEVRLDQNNWRFVLAIIQILKVHEYETLNAVIPHWSCLIFYLPVIDICPFDILWTLEITGVLLVAVYFSIFILIAVIVTVDTIEGKNLYVRLATNLIRFWSMWRPWLESPTHQLLLTGNLVRGRMVAQTNSELDYSLEWIIEWEPTLLLSIDWYLSNRISKCKNRIDDFCM